MKTKRFAQWIVLLLVLCLACMSPVLTAAAADGNIHLDVQGAESIQNGIFSFIGGTLSYTCDGTQYVGNQQDVEYPGSTRIVITMTAEEGYTSLLQVGQIHIIGETNGLVTTYTFTLSECASNNVAAAFASFQDNSNPPAGQDAPTVGFRVQNQTLEAGSVQYKIGSGSWTTVGLAVNSGSDENGGTWTNLSGSVTESLTAGTVLYVRAIPGNGYALDTVRGVNIWMNGQSSPLSTASVLSENGCEIILSENAPYEIELGFSQDGGNPPSGGDENLLFTVILDNTENGMEYGQLYKDTLGTVEYAIGRVETENGQNVWQGTDWVPVNEGITITNEQISTVEKTGNQYLITCFAGTSVNGDLQFRLNPVTGKEVENHLVNSDGYYRFIAKDVQSPYHVKFVDFGTSEQPDPYAGLEVPENGFQLRLDDGLGNFATLEELQALGTDSPFTSLDIEYSYDNSTWQKLTTGNIETDSSAAVIVSTGTSHAQAYNFIGQEHVYIRIAANPAGGVMRSDFGLNGDKTFLTEGQAYELSKGVVNQLWYDNGIYSLDWIASGERPDEQPDMIVDNGTARVIAINDVSVDSEEFGSLGINNGNTETGGYWRIPKGTRVTILLAPDYGYQLAGTKLNGGAFEAGVNVSTFTFVMPDVNVHLAAIFIPVADEVNISSEAVGRGNISCNSGNVINSGNLRLSVADVTDDAAKTALDAVAAKSDADVKMYLDLNLTQVVSKGNEEAGEWTAELHELQNSVTVQLSVTAPQAGKTYSVFRAHEVDGTIVYDELPVQYDEATGTIIFTTDKFSDYAVVETNEIQYGDVNGDGKLNTTDALLSLRAAIKKITFTEAQIRIADVNGDSRLDTTDALHILKKAVNPAYVFPVEK